jgi:glutathione S-transferase
LVGPGQAFAQITPMIELFQLPHSPFCIVQRRLLEYAGARFKLINITVADDRAVIWRLTRQRYYQVPIIRDGRTVIFETDDDSQVIAKYLDLKLGLGLFPRTWAGVQAVLWRYFEHQIEDVGFRLNDARYREWLPRSQWLAFLRHKERKFGRGCLDQWRQQENELLAELERRLLPCELMLADKPFLLGPAPLFVDFDLYGMLGNFLYSGCYQIPARLKQLRDWHTRMTTVHKPVA